MDTIAKSRSLWSWQSKLKHLFDRSACCSSLNVTGSFAAFLLGLVLVFYPGSAFSQPKPPPAAAASPSTAPKPNGTPNATATANALTATVTSPPESQGFFADIWNAVIADPGIKAGIVSLLTLIIGAGITAAVAAVQASRREKKLSELVRTAEGLSQEKETLQGDKRKLEETAGQLKQVNNELTRRLAGVRFGLPENYIETYNKVLLVGLEGVMHFA